MTVDANPFWRARVGIMFPQLDFLTEPWLVEVLPRGISFHVSRMERTGPITRESLLQMNRSMRVALRLLPLEFLDLVVYHCTAGSLLYDPAKLVSEMETETGLPAVATMQAVIDAMQHLELSRVTMVTPYMPNINDFEEAFLSSKGFTVVGVGGVHMEDAGLMQRTTADEVCLWARRAFRRSPSDGIFISCTALRSLSFVEELEADLGVPVVTSGAAMLWAVLNRLNVSATVAKSGRLLASGSIEGTSRRLALASQ